MAEDSLAASKLKHVNWHEDEVPVRGYRLSLEDIKIVYRELLEINRTFGEKIIANLPRDEDLTEEQWEERKSFLLEDAFCLTTTISGLGNKQLYGETEEVFSDPNLPKPTKSIYFTNITAFQRHSNGELPPNQIRVLLDFNKPDIADPLPLVSAATHNEGKVTILADDIAFFNAIQRTIDTKLAQHKTWYGAIHRNFVYDIGMWLLVVPASLYFSAFYMDQIIPFESKFELFRWPLFIYLNGCALIFYRALTSYAKWTFPVNILVENKDKAFYHRVVLGGIVSWLFYKFASTVYGIAAASI